MKKINLLFAAFFIIALTTSCNSYLDTVPDDRAEVNTIDKVKKLLTSAYCTHSNDFIMETSSDNIMDNGAQYAAQPNQDKAYRWEPIETQGNDDPRSLWSSAYSAIGTANLALEALNGLEVTAETKGMKAEALLCRAYTMFMMANTFCMAWNPDHADDYLGLPYPKVAGVSVNERGTLGELYANINGDIEEALPMLNDSHLEVPKYHFNTKAAYAFAARFNLYYLNYDKAIEYATKVLGNNPATLLRQTSEYASLGAVDIFPAYTKTSVSANLMLLPAYSLAGRMMSSSSFKRYAHAYDIILYETFWAKAPWVVGNSSTNNVLYESHKIYGNNQQTRYPKMDEQFEYTDKINGTGYAHIVDVVFTTDETLLVRAEAYTMKKDYTNALADLNTFASVRFAAQAGTAVRPTFTESSINTFYDALPEVPAVIEDAAQRGNKKPLHPQGFTVEAGTQTNLLYCILHLRRIETYHQGLRFNDIKRYGIEFSHNLDGEPALEFKAGDLRGAIQLPSDVLAAGLEANPRNN